jgi:hypothetical protein
VVTAEVRDTILLRCLGFLRYRLAGLRPHILECFHFDHSDRREVDLVAQTLGEHVGLRQLQYTVIEEVLGPHRGGRVELWFGQEHVTIAASNAAWRFAPSLMATIAHELCHKLLFDRGAHGDDLMYEILTDVAAVYVGFGKLLLNGYEYRTQTGTLPLGRPGDHVRFGYITTHEAAFVHAMVCRIRGAQEQDLKFGLSAHAGRAMDEVLSDARLIEHVQRAPLLAPRISYR